MPVKKCPACGSKCLKKIIYGEPTYEDMDSTTRGQIVLGGCCVEHNSPTYFRSECNKEFGSFSMQPIRGFKSFEFFQGGYFGPSHFIFINNDGKSKIIKYAFSADGRFIDLKESFPDEPDFLENIKIKEMNLDEEQWFSFLKDIEKCEIKFWNEEYIDSDILDGTQWSIEIIYEDGSMVTRSGSNAYPPMWKKLLNVWKKYLNENVR